MKALFEAVTIGVTEADKLRAWLRALFADG
jgi:hypothetical protein